MSLSCPRAGRRSRPVVPAQRPERSTRQVGVERSTRHGVPVRSGAPTQPRAGARFIGVPWPPPAAQPPPTRSEKYVSEPPPLPPLPPT